MTARTLVLLRHAKAAAAERLADLDRPLTARGHADAAAAGAWLRAKELRPALVFCSPSRRTRETWHGVRLALGDAATSTSVVYEPALYDSDAQDVLDLIRASEPALDVVLVIGHNPTVSILSALLDPGSDTPDGLRTGGLAVHRFDGGWADCAPNGAPLVAAHTARAD